MSQIIEGWATVFTSIVNFMFKLDFGDGTTLGGIYLAICVLAIVIRFLFRSIQAGPGAASFMINDYKIKERKRQNAVVRSIENVLRRNDE